MMSAERTAASSPEMRRVAIASCVGTAVEFYDFYIYGTAAALVFPKVFFPALGSTAGTVASFATFAVAFVARPVGAVSFGHYGDRLGRKRTLIVTLLLMGVSTMLIGLLPGAATIGVTAPVLLVVLRFTQGFAVGGEWAGATLLTAEYAPAGQRGRYGMFPQLGATIALALSSATFLIIGLTLGNTDRSFLDYGWRIPFLVSIVLVGVGLYVRLKIEETPVFREAQRRHPAAQAPLREAFTQAPREILLAAGATTIMFALFYTGTTYLTSYGTSPAGAGLSRTLQPVSLDELLVARQHHVAGAALTAEPRLIHAVQGYADLAAFQDILDVPVLRRFLDRLLHQRLGPAQEPLAVLQTLAARIQPPVDDVNGNHFRIRLSRLASHAYTTPQAA